MTPMQSENLVQIECPEAVTLSGGAAAARTARLLVAGEFPKITLTAGDLDALAANFAGPVPVKVEHIDSPLDPLGQVEAVWREGDALMGRLSFPAGIAAHLSDRGARGLSVGLWAAPRWELIEASLTSSPHIPAATLLSQDALAPPALAPCGVGPHPPAPSPGPSQGGGDCGRGGVREVGEDAELVRLREDLRAERVEAQIGELKRAGRLVPAGEPFARALLAQDQAPVTLSDDGEAEAAAALFLRFLQAQPPAVRLSEAAPGGGSAKDQADEIEFDADAQGILKTLGVDPAKVAQTLRADQTKGRQ